MGTVRCWLDASTKGLVICGMLPAELIILLYWTVPVGLSKVGKFRMERVSP